MIQVFSKQKNVWKFDVKFACYQINCHFVTDKRSVWPLGWVLSFKKVQTTWKGSSAPGTGSQLSIMLSATGTQRWGGGLEVTVWAGRGWQPSALTPCLTPPVEKCWQTDSRDVKVGEWRRRKERKESQHLVLADLRALLCPKGNSSNTRPPPTCRGGPQQH